MEGVANQSASAHQQPFMILGHGAEDIELSFEERQRLPDGYTLVTLAECGMTTEMETVSPFLAAFKDPHTYDIFRNPALPSNKTQIEKLLNTKIHVYKPGNLYPSFKIRALTDWKINEDQGLKLMKSGLYSYPLDTELFVEPYDKPYNILKEKQVNFGMRGKIPESFAEPIKQLYKGAIFPTSQMVEEAWNSANLNYSDFGNSMLFPLEEFFRAGGPGVYFYIICRSPLEIDDDEMSIDAFVNQFVLNKNIRKSFKVAQNKISLIPKIIPIAEAAAAKEKNRLAKGGKKYWSTNNTLEMPEKLQGLYNRTNKTRRMSIAQQEAKGGRRRQAKRRSIKKQYRLKKPLMTRRVSRRK